jgi:hypothetical protein
MKEGGVYADVDILLDDMGRDEIQGAIAAGDHLPPFWEKPTCLQTRTNTLKVTTSSYFKRMDTFNSLVT